MLTSFVASIAPPLVVMVVAGAAAAAGTNRNAVTESYDPASPEVPSASSADMVVVHSTRIGGGGLQWSHADMGLPPGANIDAFSDGTDVLPPIPPVHCRSAVIEFTVDRMTKGLPGSLVEAQAAAAGNGAASDTFGVGFSSGGGVTYYLASDGLNVTSRTAATPVETDLDALAWREKKRWPVYFSVDPATAASIGVSPADVLLAKGDKKFAVLFSEAGLGLAAGDDIDAIAFDGVDLVFSLSPSSPTATSGAFAGVAAAGLLRFSGAALSTYVPPATLKLKATDNLNGVRITDPGREESWDGSQTAGIPALPYDTLLIEGTAGNVPHLVEVETGQPFLFQVKPLVPANGYVVLFTFGRPCTCSELPCPSVPGFLAFGATPLGCAGSPAKILLTGSGPLQVPAVLNQPLDLTLQAVLGFTQIDATSNMITLRVN